MFAIVRTGGKQYRVAAGDKIAVEKLPGEAGDKVSLGDVLLAGNADGIQDSAKLTVSAEIIAQDGDITMPELSAALFAATRVQAHPNAIGKFLRKLGYTYKKVTGGHRTSPGQGKATARRLVQAPHSSRVEAPGPRCLY